MTIQSAAVQDQPVIDPGFKDPALFKIRDLIYRVSGIFQAENKFYLLADRSRRRMKVLACSSFSEYLGHLTSHSNRETEIRSLLNEITIGETYFFRSQPQIDAIAKIILPKLTAQKAKQTLKKIRIWSAGCSTGEEPYTYSILFSELFAAKYADWTFDIFATDLNDNSLTKCREGLYGDYSVRNLGEQQRDKYFTREGSLYRVKESVRAKVTFDRLNLQDHSRILFMAGFDIVLCCNVLIYFDAVSKRKTVEHFFNGLTPGGYFFLGNSESLFGIYDQFHLIHFPNATGYCKPLPGEPSGGPR